jgi:hypothetical protein
MECAAELEVLARRDWSNLLRGRIPRDPLGTKESKPSFRARASLAVSRRALVTDTDGCLLSLLALGGSGVRRHIRCLCDGFIALLQSSTQLALVIAIGMAYFQVWKAYGVSGYDAFRRWYQHKSIKEWVLQSDINDNTIQHQDIYLVNGVEHTIAVYSPYIRFFHGLPLPRSCRILSGAPKAHDITRSGPNQLDIIVLGGNFLDGGLAKLYRAGRFRFRPNQVMSLKGLTIKLLALSDRRPYRARFIFEKPLEDPSYLFLHSTEEGLRRFELPEVGKSVRLPVAQFPTWRLR